MNDKDIKTLQVSFPYLLAGRGFWAGPDGVMVPLNELKKEHLKSLPGFLKKEKSALDAFTKNTGNKFDLEDKYYDKLSEVEDMLK